ncbi:polymer-forming cytoskeletal protein [Erwinia aphidicola]|uniref:bactofilin family protein n=1 Tax=Erwinia aphidicola TaxID=68334 RepID=UPI0030CBFFCD
MCDRRLCVVSEKNHVPPGYRRRTLYFIFIYLIFAQKRMVAHVLNFSKKDRDAGVGKNAPALNTEPAKAATSERHDDLMIKETTISLGSVLRGEITNENNITVNGTVEGNITSQKITQIGKEGSVVGTVKSAKLVINGLLKGSCHAGSVTIMSRGRVEGEIYTNELAIEKGGPLLVCLIRLKMRWHQPIRERKGRLRPAIKSLLRWLPLKIIL